MITGYNYEDCDVCPLNVAKKLGWRNIEEGELPRKNDKRPNWAIFAKLTQHTETILFKEKFLNWPDYSRVIRIKENELERSDSQIEIVPCDVDNLIEVVRDEPDLVIEGAHIGRGRTHYDDELRRTSLISTIELRKWRIMENTYEEIDSALLSLGDFYDSETYIIKWKYRLTVTGRELGGKPSKHAQIGRDRTIYFCWLGEHASINEKGAAAILTIELDNENAPQIRVTQGNEPAAFLQLFDGKMIVYSGKQTETKDDKKLFIIRGEIGHEASLLQV